MLCGLSKGVGELPWMGCHWANLEHSEHQGKKQHAVHYKPLNQTEIHTCVLTQINKWIKKERKGYFLHWMSTNKCQRNELQVCCFATWCVQECKKTIRSKFDTSLKASPHRLLTPYERKHSVYTTLTRDKVYLAGTGRLASRASWGAVLRTQHHMCCVPGPHCLNQTQDSSKCQCHLWRRQAVVMLQVSGDSTDLIK